MKHPQVTWELLDGMIESSYMIFFHLQYSDVLLRSGMIQGCFLINHAGDLTFSCGSLHNIDGSTTSQFRNLFQSDLPEEYKQSKYMNCILNLTYERIHFDEHKLCYTSHLQFKHVSFTVYDLLYRP